MSQHYKADLLMRLEQVRVDFSAACAILSRGNISDWDKQYLERQVSKHKAEFEELSKEYEHMTGEPVTNAYTLGIDLALSGDTTVVSTIDIATSETINQSVTSTVRLMDVRTKKD